MNHYAGVDIFLIDLKLTTLGCWRLTLTEQLLRNQHSQHTALLGISFDKKTVFHAIESLCLVILEIKVRK